MDWYFADRFASPVFFTHQRVNISFIWKSIIHFFCKKKKKEFLFHLRRNALQSLWEILYWKQVFPRRRDSLPNIDEKYRYFIAGNIRHSRSIQLRVPLHKIHFREVESLRRIRHIVCECLRHDLVVQQISGERIQLCVDHTVLVDMCNIQFD